MAPFIPALLLALFAAWSGTYDLGTTAAASSAGLLALAGTLLFFGSPRRDPLRLGVSGRLLPPALWISTAVSLWASPVPRAGKMGILLLPAFLYLPGAVARCWRSEADRRWGLRAVALGTAGISLWALMDWLVRGLERPALPLGHHNLLAAWLVIVLPLAVLPTREPGRWRFVGIAGGALAVVTILATRSLGGAAALAVEVLALILWKRRQKGMTVLLALLILAGATQLPRLMRIATGEDPSARSRAVYYAAGWEGFLARPGLGWGPGSTPWTLSAFTDPVPGASPRTEAVGDLHSLPLQIAYELGLPGLLLAVGIAAVFAKRRLQESQGSEPVVAGLLGIAGGAVASLASGAIAVTALPLAVAVAAGAALSKNPEERGSDLPARLYALLALLAVLTLAPSELARWHYDRARAADVTGRRDVARAEIARAVALDPSYPLYRMRLALLGGGDPAASALRAAEDGVAVPMLWTVAGILGYTQTEPWASAALERACSLAPLDPLPPFYLMLADPPAPVHGAHALLADPRLAAATVWGRRPLEQALEEVRRWPGVDPGWKEALIAAARSPEPRSGFATRKIGLEMDTDETLAGQSLSLAVFRRRPWPLEWRLVTVREDLLPGLSLPPATTLRTTAADLRCSANGHPLLTP